MSFSGDYFVDDALYKSMFYISWHCLT